MILDSTNEPFFIQNWSSGPDGLGGWTWELTDGVEFQATIKMDNSTEARIAEAQGLKTFFTVIVDKKIRLEFEDIIRRINTNEYYRITSNSADMETPVIANMQIASVTAERWEKPI